MSEQDTIAAISTGATQAGVGIVRVSGPDAVAVVDRIFRTKSGKRTLSGYLPGSLHLGTIIAEDGTVIDEVLVSVFYAPHSYTAENTVEINGHGGVFLLRKILLRVLEEGARLAQPGEFTKRAFLNGRLDLSQAEAVMDLICADNEAERKRAVSQLSGRLSGKIRAIRKELLHELAFIESALDDPENFDTDGYPEQLSAKLTALRAELNELISQADYGILIKEGIQTAIVGRPNAGKSSLLNRLLGKDRAIVTDIPGTTRDLIEESARFSEITLHLIDTAGIHSTEDTVEQIGIERSMDAVGKAGLILFMLDYAAGITEEDRKIAERIRTEKAKDARVILLVNKTDLPEASGNDVTAQSVPAEEIAACFNEEAPILFCSMKTGEGLQELEERIRELFYKGSLPDETQGIIGNLRQKKAAESAEHSIGLVLQSIADGLSEDFYSIDLMDAYTRLGEILGEQVGDDLVEEIFSSFCLGK